MKLILWKMVRAFQKKEEFAIICFNQSFGRGVGIQKLSSFFD